MGILICITFYPPLKANSVLIITSYIICIKDVITNNYKFDGINRSKNSSIIAIKNIGLKILNLSTLVEV
jgi:hypothetical protein